MRRRKKHFPDYVKMHKSMRDKKKIDKKVEESAGYFYAANAILKDELPKLYDLSKDLILAVLQVFIELVRQFMGKWVERLGHWTEISVELGLDESLRDIMSRFHYDFSHVERAMQQFGIVNGSILQNLQNNLSPIPMPEGSTSATRPSTHAGSERRTMSGHSDQYQPQYSSSSQRNSGHSYNSFPNTTSFDSANGFQGRARASSGLSSRGPATPRTISAQGPSTYFGQPRPSTGADSAPEAGMGGFPRVSLDIVSSSSLRPASDSNYLLPDRFQTHHSLPNSGTSLSSALMATGSSNGYDSPGYRGSGIFSSAMPMAESPTATAAVFSSSSSSSTAAAAAAASSHHQAINDYDEPKVLFLAASLFEFNIDGSRREAGYPYLQYVPGEIFDVIAQKGELWLARNQDDGTGVIGWIWEKHFARILPTDL